jgi:hypothetical protein
MKGIEAFACSGFQFAGVGSHGALRNVAVLALHFPTAAFVAPSKIKRWGNRTFTSALT